MSITRLALRQRIGRWTWGEYFTTGDVLASPAPHATNGFALTELIDSGAKDNQRFVGAWCYLVPDSEERRIITWTKTSGLIVPHRPWSSTPSSGDDVEIHRFPVTVIHEGINEALRKMRYTTMVDLTIDGDVNYIDLSSFTYIRSQKDIVGLYAEDTEGNLQEVDFGRMYENDRLYIYPPPIEDAGYTLKLRVNRRLAEVDDDADIIDADPDWILYGAMMHIYDIMMRRAGPAKDVSRLGAEREDVRRRFRRHSRLNNKNHPRKINFGTAMRTHWGANYAS